MANKYVLGFMILVILTSSVYILLPNNVRIDVQNTKTIFKVFENDKWVLAGTEYTILYDGTTKMRAKSRAVNYSISGNVSTITRVANFKDGITAIDTYIFNGNTKDVSLYPVKHNIRILNGLGKILSYEVWDLTYNGPTIKGVTSPQTFGHKMEVEWEDGNYYSKIYRYKNKEKGKLIVRYRVDSNDFSKDVRLFDPVPVPDVDYSSDTPANETWLNYNSLYVGVNIGSCANFSNATYYLSGVT